MPCPRCGSPLGAPDNDGMVVCANGHRAYSGFLAEAAQLTLRLRWLEGRIEAGDLPPDAETARRYGIWPAVTGDRAAGAPAGLDPAPGRGPQALLLTLGAVLIVVAAIVFTAVVWKDLGAAGQVVVLAAATLVVGAAAVRLVEPLPGTGEALAVVAFALASIDAVAAPALGLLPTTWVTQWHPYPAAITACLSAGGVLLGHHLRLRAWRWLGWLAAAASAGLATSYLANGLANRAEPGASLAVSVVALAAMGLLAAPEVSTRLAGDGRELRLAGALAGLWAVLSVMAFWSEATTSTALGTMLTMVVTASAAGAVWGRTRQRSMGVGAVALASVAVGLALLLPGGQHTYAIAVAAAGAGALVLVVLIRVLDAELAVLASALVWGTWLLARLTTDRGGAYDTQVVRQLTVVAASAAVAWYVVSGLGLLRVVAWPAAIVGEVAWLSVDWSHAGVIERWTLPFAALLLGAGVLWRRTGGVGSMTWLGPAVGVALLPSAAAGWAAPWVTELSDQSTGSALARLVGVLVAAAAAVALGASRRSSGLLVPGAAALVVIAGAQVWGGLAATPRWLAIAVVGAALLATGARLEWLRAQGFHLRHYLDGLQ